MTSPPLYSPVICKDFFPLFTCINRVGTMLYSISIWVLCSLSQHLSKSWNQLHCSLQAFGYYCEQLPGLTTKSIHYYSYSYHFRTRFTFYCTKDTASNAVLPFRATWLFDAQAHNATVSRCPNSHDSATRVCRLYNREPHTSSNWNKIYFGSLYPSIIK